MMGPSYEKFVFHVLEVGRSSFEEICKFFLDISWAALTCNCIHQSSLQLMSIQVKRRWFRNCGDIVDVVIPKSFLFLRVFE